MKTQTPTEIYWTSAQQIFLANVLCQKATRLRVTVIKANSLRVHQRSSVSFSLLHAWKDTVVNMQWSLRYIRIIVLIHVETLTLLFTIQANWTRWKRPCSYCEKNNFVPQVLWNGLRIPREPRTKLSQSLVEMPWLFYAWGLRPWSGSHNHDKQTKVQRHMGHGRELYGPWETEHIITYITTFT